MIRGYNLGSFYLSISKKATKYQWELSDLITGKEYEGTEKTPDRAYHQGLMQMSRLIHTRKHA